jgi:hypothetical protein
MDLKQGKATKKRQEIIYDAKSSEAILGIEFPFPEELVIITSAGLDFYSVCTRIA